MSFSGDRHYPVARIRFQAWMLDVSPLQITLIDGDALESISATGHELPLTITFPFACNQTLTNRVNVFIAGCPPKPHRTTNFRSSRFTALFAETRKPTPPYQARKSQEVLRQTGFETTFSGNCRGRSQELLALRPTGSGAATPPERVGGLGTGGAESTTSQTG